MSLRASEGGKMRFSFEKYIQPANEHLTMTSIVYYRNLMKIF